MHPQPSHGYQVTFRDVFKLLAWPLACMAVLIVAVRGATHFHWLPPARPCADVEQTVLVHQADASRSAPVPAVVFCGDSSCLMNVDARDLEQHLKVSCLNLGTVSYLDLMAHGQLIRQALDRADSKPRWVVLLLHPETLRRASGDTSYKAFLEGYLQGALPYPGQSLRDSARAFLGLEDFETRVWSRVCPTPLPGAFGRFYGHNWNLEDYMSQHRGSAVDPGQRPFSGNAEYQLAITAESQSRRFREMLPSSARIAVGISPVPESFVPEEYKNRSAAMLEEWGRYLEAQAVLRELPRTLPDSDFASVTHLNRRSVDGYTRQLAQALEKWLANAAEPP